MSYTVRSVGQPGTLAHRIFLGLISLKSQGKYIILSLEHEGRVLSPFHDVPLTVPGQPDVFNMVVEIPRWSNAKLEICKDEFMNPIKQDIKNNKLRFVKNCFPFKGYIWNYGAFPQTWEDPTVAHPEAGANGDNDPVDVLEIGSLVAYSGQVKQVKVLGTFALLDEGETDWKIVAIDVNDPLAKDMHDIGDVEKHMPGLLDATKTWFRIYKVPDGKPYNTFALNGAIKDKAYALNVIHETNDAWKRLIGGQIPCKTEKYNISCSTTEYPGKYLVSKTATELNAIGPHSVQEPATIDPSVDKWYFVK